MTDLNSTFLALLRMGLWGKAEDTNLTLSPEAWTAIYQIACKQTVQGIIYDALEMLPREQQPPKPLLLRWAVDVDRIERENTKQIQELKILKIIFYERYKLPFRLQKGQGIAQLYRNRLHRICGDFDLWFGNGKNVEKANQYIELQGIKVQRGNHEDAIYEWNGIDVEHHSEFIELSNPFLLKDLRKWEEKVYRESTEELIPEANLFLQITHILKHLLTEGIGLRQMCDLAVSITHLQYDKEELKRLCKKYGVYKWTLLLLSFLHTYLGVPEEKLPYATTENPETLLAEIWESGNFGHNDTRFGTRPTGKWASKFYTLKMFMKKQRLFFKYAPSESFWRLGLLLAQRTGEALHVIKEKPNYT